ncbi:hypothetical protein pclt_cds_1083 [Pandoravirus celtis]|uniref:Uncharacterized protein n=1 Tax=Pandoravirus celtis TaxID=2568002 RepID=A0A4D6EIJ2_9VIRU|nr:hypothetical protein pclt_cds_1083 [Pandoravirus celtis]
MYGNNAASVGTPAAAGNNNNYYSNNTNTGRPYGSVGASYGAPAYGAPTTAATAYGAPPYAGTTAVLPRYGGPGAYYGTHTPAATAAAAPYATVYGGNGTLVGGPVVSPTRPNANGNDGGGPVVSPTAPPTTPTGPVAPPTVPPTTGPVAPPSNLPRRRQRPTWVSLINGMGAAVEARWQSGGLSGTFRVPQSHAHVFMAPAPIDTLRLYALTSDGPPNDPIYDGPRQPAPGIPEPGPALNLLATGCGVFETMLDFYPGSVSGNNGSTTITVPPAQNGAPNGRPPVMPPPPLPPSRRTQNGANGGQPPIMPAPSAQNGNNNGPPIMPAQNGNTNTGTPGRPVVGSFGTWRATDIAAAWARTCHGGHCGTGHPAEVDALAPYVASVIPPYTRGR